MTVEPPGGGESGAEYVPLLSMVPCTPSPPAVPFTSQVTPTAVAPFWVAVNVAWEPAGMEAAAGLTVTPCAAVTVTTAVAVNPPDVAVTATCAGLGTDAGAVYTPLEVIEPPEEPLTAQVTVAVG